MKLSILLLCCLSPSVLLGQDEFSGPQKGEPLPDCELKVIFGPQKGKTIKLLEQVKDKPNTILFVHEVTRPAVGLIRKVADYAKKREKDGLVTNVVFLTSDPTDTTNWMNRASRALPQGINVSISMDGIEGPGAFGLNRKMQVTGIIANKKKVTANFALIQPSMQVDGPKIAGGLAKVLGDKKMPTAKELGIVQRGRQNGKYEQLMRPFIQKTNTDEKVEMLAKGIEEAAAKDPALKKRIHEVTNRIIGAGKLENYGTEKAQGFLKKWSKEFASKDKSKGESKRGR